MHNRLTHCHPEGFTPKLDGFFRTFATGRRPLLMLDYDGTLAPFRIDRLQAVPWPGVRDALTLIESQGKTRLVIVTGRPAAEIAPLLGLATPGGAARGVEVWGLHGFERLHSDGRREQRPLPAIAAQTLAELHAQLRQDSFGGLFEAKANAAVMHWRGATPEQAAEIERRTRALFEPAAKPEARIDGFKLLPFDGGLELRAGPDKSAAVEALLAESPPSTPAAYLGDDLTDEVAFRALKDRGVSVLVRPEWRQTEAEVWLRPPEELVEFLQRWLEELEAPTLLIP